MDAMDDLVEVAIGHDDHELSRRWHHYLSLRSRRPWEGGEKEMVRGVGSARQNPIPLSREAKKEPKSKLIIIFSTSPIPSLANITKRKPKFEPLDISS